jgi:polar amino acid transport system substrate-binding protein
MNFRLFLLLGLTFLSPPLFAQLSTPAPEPDTLRMAYYGSPPFVVLDDDQEVKGVTPWLWDRIKPELMLSFRQQRMPLDSLLRSMGRGEIDVSMVPLSITSERSELIDFSAPF